MTHDEALEILDSYHRRSTGFLGCSDKQVLEALQWAKECMRVVKAQQGGDLSLLTPIRPKGHWIFKKTVFDKFGNTVECSSCHKKWKTYDEIGWRKENKFCPNCGADMRGEK